MSNKRDNIDINYLSRDFQTIKADLLRYAKRYYPDTFKDFSTAGFGALMLDAVAYTSDMLSFYLDYQANESFLSTAVEYENVLKHGQTVGYKHQGARATHGVVTLYALIPANSDASGPDMNYAPILKAGSTLSSTAAALFTLTSDVSFASSENEIVVAKTNSTTGEPTFYAVRASGQVVSGENRVKDFKNLGDFVKFRKLTLPGNNVTEIISVTDSNGNEYFEVENLSQNTIFTSIANNDTTTNVTAPTVIKPIIVPRRFVVKRDRFATNILFGYGSDSELKSASMAEPRDIVMDLHSRTYVTDKSFDPSELVKSDKFGIAPANTDIRVVYRANTSQNSNASANTITSVVGANVEFPSRTSLVSSKMAAVRASIEATNDSPIQGDVSAPNINDLRELISGAHSAQNRAVTMEDYKSLVLTMPPRFGGVKRCSIVRDIDSNLRNINIYVISEVNGYFQATNEVLKQNIKTWLNSKRVINDSVDILDAKVVNLKVKFEVVAVSGVNTTQVLDACTRRLRQLFSSKLDIGEAFNITNIYAALNSVPHVADATWVKIEKASGTSYSSINFNVKNMTSPDGRFVRAPKNVVFEVKYPNTDIIGTVK